MMRSGLCVLLGLVVLCASAEWAAFGEQAVNAIFKEKKDSIILFSRGESVTDVFKDRAAADENEVLYTTVDEGENADHFKRFGEYLGVSVEKTPVLVVLKEGKNKYVAP